MTGRIIDADVDALANIDRLTAQVEGLTGQRDGMLDTIKKLHSIMSTPAWVNIVDHARGLMSDLEVTRQERDEARIQVEVERGDKRRLQESLTAAEQERDAAKSDKVRALDMKYAMADRVRVLEGALREVIRWGDKLSWSIMSDACGWIYGIAKDALTPAPPAASHTIDCNEGMTYGDSCSCAPPAETPAPTYKHGIVEIGACLSCIERDRLRAELAAANEGFARRTDALGAERAAHERTKAELVAEHADRLNIDEHRGRLLRERDAAQAEAAAMRSAIIGVIEYQGIDHDDDGCPEDDTCRCENIARVNAALKGTAGRALATRVPLLEAVAKDLKTWRDQLAADGPPSGTGAWITREIDSRFPALAELAALNAQEPK